MDIFYFGGKMHSYLFQLDPVLTWLVIESSTRHPEMWPRSESPPKRQSAVQEVGAEILPGRVMRLDRFLKSFQRIMQPL